MGDTNYSNFCRAGRTIDARLAELGASALLPRGDAGRPLGIGKGKVPTDSNER